VSDSRVSNTLTSLNRDGPIAKTLAPVPLRFSDAKCATDVKKDVIANGIPVLSRISFKAGKMIKSWDGMGDI
jgi:hypothetical protein